MMRVPAWQWWLLAIVLATGCNLNPQPEPPFQEPEFDGVAGGSGGGMASPGGAGAGAVATPDDPTGGAGVGGSEQGPTLNPAGPHPNGMEAGGVRNHPDGGVADAGYVPLDPQH